VRNVCCLLFVVSLGPHNRDRKEEAREVGKRRGLPKAALNQWLKAAAKWDWNTSVKRASLLSNVVGEDEDEDKDEDVPREVTR